MLYKAVLVSVIQQCESAISMHLSLPLGASPVTQHVKNPLEMQETQETRVQFLSWEDPLEEEMAMHSSILVWEIP